MITMKKNHNHTLSYDIDPLCSPRQDLFNPYEKYSCILYGPVFVLDFPNPDVATVATSSSTLANSSPPRTNAIRSIPRCFQTRETKRAME